MAKAEVTAGVIETRLRTRAQSKLKAELSVASSPLREMARRTVGERGFIQSIDRLESELYQDLVDHRERDEIEDFIKVNDATRELLRDPPVSPAPAKTARAS